MFTWMLLCESQEDQEGSYYPDFPKKTKGVLVDFLEESLKEVLSVKVLKDGQDDRLHEKKPDSFFTGDQQEQ